MVKRYLVTNTTKTDLPLDFISSKDERHISVLNIKLIDLASGKLLMDISAHSDFVIDHPDFGGFLCFCNEQLAKRKKWEIYHQPRSFNLEFRRFDTGALINPLTVSFVAEFMLEF